VEISPGSRSCYRAPSSYSLIELLALVLGQPGSPPALVVVLLLWLLAGLGFEVFVLAPPA